MSYAVTPNIRMTASCATSGRSVPSDPLLAPHLRRRTTLGEIDTSLTDFTELPKVAQNLADARFPAAPPRRQLPVLHVRSNRLPHRERQRADPEAKGPLADARGEEGRTRNRGSAATAHQWASLVLTDEARPIRVDCSVTVTSGGGSASSSSRATRRLRRGSCRSSCGSPGQ